MSGIAIPSVRDVMDSIVSVSRFNRGEATKIFEEVHAKGMKVVLKNNAPVCVLLAPKRYEEMLEKLEDYALLLEAEERMKNTEGETFSQEQVMAELGITQEDLDSVEVEIE